MDKSIGPMGGTWGAAIVAAPDLHEAERAIRRGMPQTKVEAVVTSRVPHLVVRFPLPDMKQWAEVRASLCRLTVASGWLVLTVAPRVESDDTEWRLARGKGLLPLATRLPSARRMIDVDELLVFDVLATTTSTARTAIVRDVLGPLLRLPGDAGRRLLTTLETLHWHNGSAKSAARSLGVHVKTVHNRLRRIEELTGLCLDHPSDRLRVEVALYLLRVTETGVSASPRLESTSGPPEPCARKVVTCP
jgi:sugar diacid utilization regulator